MKYTLNKLNLKMSLLTEFSTCLHSFHNSFCKNCGALSYQKLVTIKHPKYIYKADLDPIALLYTMISNNQSLSHDTLVDKDYLQIRQDLLSILRLTNSRLDFNSQTFFLAICYMDQVISQRLTSTPHKDYALIGVSCLLIASKFTENDPNVPEPRKYLSVLSETSKYKYNYAIDDLLYGEVYVLKHLDYKLNYYSIYHFITFFFAHGILLSDPVSHLPIINEDIGEEASKEKQGVISASASAGLSPLPVNNNKKLLEKIYILSREVLDFLIEDEAYIIMGKDNAIAAMEILKKAIEVNLPNNTIDKGALDVFELIYNISDYIDSSQRDNIRLVVNRIFDIKVFKRKDIPKLPLNVFSHQQLSPSNSTQESDAKREGIISPKSRFHLNLSEIKASLSGYYDHPTTDLSNLREFSNVIIKKRACSSSKEHITKEEELRMADFYSKNHMASNPSLFSQETHFKRSYNASTHTNTNSNLTSHNQTPSIINPLYQKYNKRPPVKSIRIKKDTATSGNGVKSNSNPCSTAPTNKTSTINGTSTTTHTVQPFSIVSPSHIQQDDILDKTKKIFEQAKKTKKEDNIDTGNTGNSNNHNRYTFSNEENIPIIPSQPLANDYTIPNYKTIIINNNININTYIQKKSTYDEHTNPRKFKLDNDKDFDKNQHHNFIFNGPSTKSKETDLLHNNSSNRQNYFGTYFDYGTDTLINKSSTKYYQQRQGVGGTSNLLNTSNVKKYGSGLMHFY